MRKHLYKKWKEGWSEFRQMSKKRWINRRCERNTRFKNRNIWRFIVMLVCDKRRLWRRLVLSAFSKAKSRDKNANSKCSILILCTNKRRKFCQSDSRNLFSTKSKWWKISNNNFFANCSGSAKKRNSFWWWNSATVTFLDWFWKGILHKEKCYDS